MKSAMKTGIARELTQFGSDSEKPPGKITLLTGASRIVGFLDRRQEC